MFDSLCPIKHGFYNENHRISLIKRVSIRFSYMDNSS